MKQWYVKMIPMDDKTNEMTVRPAKTQISLGICPVWSESSLSAWIKLGSLATHWAHSKDWPDWADAQADLSLRWAHMTFNCFFHTAAQIIPYFISQKYHKILKIRTPKNFAVIILKFEQHGFDMYRERCPKHADKMANSVDCSWSGSTRLAQTCLRGWLSSKLSFAEKNRRFYGSNFALRGLVCGAVKHNLRP